ncbi:MAG: acylphosphatase [Pseudomonadota bacterium]
MIVARRVWVGGRVQGVGFRAATQREALRLGVSGHARNLPDGRVEVLAVGEEAAVAALVAWLQRGPPSARVDRVDVQDVPAPSSAQGFVTG